MHSHSISRFARALTHDMESEYSQVLATSTSSPIMDSVELFLRLTRMKCLLKLFSCIKCSKSVSTNAYLVQIIASIAVLIVVSLTLELMSGWLRLTSVFYWLTLLTRRRLNNAHLFTILSSVVLVEVTTQATCPACISATPVLMKLFATFTACLLTSPFLLFDLLSLSTLLQLIAFSSFIQSIIPPSSACVTRLFVVPLLCFGGIVLARCTETLICSASNMSASSSSDAKSVSGWRRRHSSPRRLQRRGSFPSLPGNSGMRSFSFHGNSVSAEATLLAAAHGLVTDLLSDSANLPAKVISNLRAVAYLLAPPTPTSVRAKPFPPVSLVEVNRFSLPDSEDIPFVSERSSTFIKVSLSFSLIHLQPSTSCHVYFSHRNKSKPPLVLQAFFVECQHAPGARPPRRQVYLS